jgi:hypothetical protein
MSVLTRIKNNQITDSTILANTKIVPGSIVGSLFNANLTMTSDVTITGNLTVQGSSTYLTVASTNTYVNDPLIVMNNAFTGTNTNDIGLLFNRGSDTNQAFIWDESEDEFRLIATSETGTTYGAVTTSSYANVRVGNLTVEGAAAFGSLSTTGNIGAVNLTLSGDAAVNGGDLTTTATTFNLLTATATTVNAFTAATTLELGAATGTTNVNNNLDVDGNIAVDGENLTVSASTFNLVNTTATTVNAFGAATTLTVGATTGTLTVRNALLDVDGNATVGGTLGVTGDSTLTGDLAVNGGDLTTSATTFNLLDSTATTVNAFGAAATIDLGATSGTLTINNPTVVGSQTTQNLYNTTATTVNFAGAATTLTIAATTGNTAIRNNLDVGLTVQARDINNTVIGNVIPAAATFTTATVQGNTSLGLTSAAAINNTPIGNATASSGSFTTLISSGVTQVTNTSTATSVGTGAFRVDGGASVAGNLWVGGNINIVGSSYVISGNAGVFYGDANGFGALYAGVTGYTALPQTVYQMAADVNNYAQVNFENVNTGADASTDYVATAGNGDDNNHYINMGITSPNWDGTQENSLTTALSGNDGYLYAQGDTDNGGNLVIGASTPNRTVSVIVGGNTASNVTAVYRAPGTASTNTTTGALTVIGGVGILGNVYANNLSTGGGISAADLTLSGDLGVNGGDITTTASTFNLLDATATTVNAFGAATTIDLGATSGTLTINNPTVVGSQTTQNLYNTTATTVNFAGAATTLNIGADTGTATINNNTIDLEGNVNINKTTPSTNSTSGALVVDGGVGVAGNLNVGENVVITGNLTVQGDVTTINTATLDVEDLNITVAKGAADSAAANGAGLTVDGASATLLYNHATTSWDLNKITRVTDDTNTTNETSGALRVAGGVAIAKDLFVGGGNVITDETTFNLLDATVTTLNIAGAATTIDLGATSGTLTINNPTVVGSQTSQDLYNTTATTLNFAGAATTLTIGAVTGTTNIRNALVDIDGNATVGGTLGVTGDSTLTGDLAVNGGDLTTTASTFNLLDATATTVNAFGAAATIDLGATTGTLTINNPTVVGSQTTQDLYNTTATTLNFAGAASTLIIGATTGVANIRNATTNILGNATVGGTFGITGDTTLTGDLAVNGGDLTTTASTFNLLASNATTVSAFGAATTLGIGAGTGTLTLNNATVTTPGQIVSTRAGSATTGNGQIFLNGSTSNRIDWATAGTGAPTFTTRTDGTKVVLYPALSGSTVDYAIGIDSATMWSSVPENTSSFNFKWYGAETLVANLSGTGNFTTVGDVAVNGGDLTTTAATFNLINTDATTLNIGGAATSVVAGATTGTFSLRNANLHLPNATTIHSSQATVALLNENVTTVNGFGDATTLTLGATSGTATVRNATLSLPNTTNIHVSQSSITVANVNATTVNAFGAATVLNFASTSSNTSIRGNLISNGILVASAGLPATSATLDPSDGSTAFWVSGGSVLRGNVFITEEANISYANIYANTISTSSSTGALVVGGGVGLRANLNVSGGTVINIDQTAQPFQVKGQFATTLIYANSVTDTVTIGGSNLTPISGATLRVNGTGAMVLPVGTTGQRPGSSGNVDVRGMIRINSSLNILEYYDGAAWQSSQGSFTVINSESFSGNGVATLFTMGGPATTASTIVSINGIVQIPATSYSITDDELTFTEAPEVGDIIDVRRLTTTVSVDELGFNQNIFKANASYAYIATGTVGSTPRLLINTDGLVTVTGDMEINGNLTVKGNSDGQITIGDSNADNVAITAELNSNIVPNLDNTYDLGAPLQRWRKVYSYATVHDQTATNVSANATPTLIDTFVTSDYSSAKYLVQIKAGSTVQAAELLLVQDTANAYITTYGVLSSNVELGTFTANITSGSVNLYYTSTSDTNSNVKVHTTYIV